MFGNLMAIYYIMPSLSKTTEVRYAHENLHDLLKSVTFNVLETLCENVYLCGYPNLLVVTQI